MHSSVSWDDPLGESDQSRQKFIEALKSGEYKQVKKMLRNPVITKTFVEACMPSFLELKKLFLTNTIPVPNYQVYCEYGYAYCAVGLAYELIEGRDWSCDSSFIYEKVRYQYGILLSEIVNLNDAGYSFEEIARKLETGYYWDNSVPPLKFTNWVI